jgi:hypothetical protein
VSKSNGSGRFGFNNRGQTVTVIETPTRYSQRRKAKVAFWVTLFTVGPDLGHLERVLGLRSC